MKKPPLLYILVLIAFLVNAFGPLPLVQAQEFRLPAPGVRIDLSPEFNPPILKGIKVHPDNPFRFDFILDKGDDSHPLMVKEEATKLIKYFLASLTIPEKDLWVNLSPYEKDRIVPQSFGLTEMGRDLLAEDYMLKQITASLIYPEGEIGKKFWKRIYEESEKRFGTTNIPVNTFNKVWIIPEKAVVYENAKAGTAYVIESKLKVMLEQDYLALQKNQSQPGDMFKSELEGTCPQAGCQASKPLNVKATQGTNYTQNVNALGSQIVRELVIPELTQEVNKDKNFAQLRQVYSSLILATWYKRKIRDSILSQVYAGKNKTSGVQYTSTVIPAKAGIQFKNDVEGLYQEYLKAFKKGVYNYIKEDQDPLTQQIIPRKYFSGGEELITISKAMVVTQQAPTSFNNNGDLAVIASQIETAQQSVPLAEAQEEKNLELAQRMSVELKARILQALMEDTNQPWGNHVWNVQIAPIPAGKLSRISSYGVAVHFINSTRIEPNLNVNIEFNDEGENQGITAFTKGGPVDEFADFTIGIFRELFLAARESYMVIHKKDIEVFMTPRITDWDKKLKSFFSPLIVNNSFRVLIKLRRTQYFKTYYRVAFKDNPNSVARFLRNNTTSWSGQIDGAMTTVNVDNLLDDSKKAPFWEMSSQEEDKIKAWLQSEDVLPKDRRVGRKLFNFIFYEFSLDPGRQIHSKWVEILQHQWHLETAKQLTNLLRWFSKNYIDVEKISYEVFYNFITAYVGSYAKSPGWRDNFNYILNPAWDNDTKLKLATQNINQMTGLFPVEMVQRKAVLKAPIAGSNLYIGMEYGLVESTHGLFLVLGEDKKGQVPLNEEVVFKIGLDTQGDVFRIIMLQGTAGKQNEIRDITARLGMPPAVALMYSALQLASDGKIRIRNKPEFNPPKENFNRLLGVRRMYMPALPADSKININANYSRFALRKEEGDFGYWQTIEHLMQVTIPGRLGQNDLQADSIKKMMSAASAFELVPVVPGKGFNSEYNTRDLASISDDGGKTGWRNWMVTPWALNTKNYPAIHAEHIVRKQLEYIKDSGVRLADFTGEIAILGFSAQEFEEVFRESPKAHYNLINYSGDVVQQEASALWDKFPDLRQSDQIKIYQMDAKDMEGKFGPGYFQMILANGIFSDVYRTKNENSQTVQAIKNTLSPQGIAVLRMSPTSGDSFNIFKEVGEKGIRIISKQTEGLPAIIFQMDQAMGSESDRAQWAEGVLKGAQVGDRVIFNIKEGEAMSGPQTGIVAEIKRLSITLKIGEGERIFFASSPQQLANLQVMRFNVIVRNNMVFFGDKSSFSKNMVIDALQNLLRSFIHVDESQEYIRSTVDGHYLNVFRAIASERNSNKVLSPITIETKPSSQFASILVNFITIKNDKEVIKWLENFRDHIRDNAQIAVNNDEAEEFLRQLSVRDVYILAAWMGTSKSYRLEHIGLGVAGERAELLLRRLNSFVGGLSIDGRDKVKQRIIELVIAKASSDAAMTRGSRPQYNGHSNMPIEERNKSLKEAVEKILKDDYKVPEGSQEASVQGLEDDYFILQLSKEYEEFIEVRLDENGIALLKLNNRLNDKLNIDDGNIVRLVFLAVSNVYGDFRKLKIDVGSERSRNFFGRFLNFYHSKLTPRKKSLVAESILLTKKFWNELRSNAFVSPPKDGAMTTENTGGIDLTSDKALTVQNNGQSIEFHIDPAQLRQLQNAPGFVPVVISIKPMTDLKGFLGIVNQTL